MGTFRPLAGLTRKNAATEVLGGVTLLAIAMPLNIGYAQIAGLPPTAGLYAMILPTIAFSLIVSSRQLIASPDAASAALVASSLTGLATAGSAGYIAMAGIQALMCGVMFLLMAYFKLGFLANFLSKPILVGFVGGLALDILTSQVAKMLGISLEAGSEFAGKVQQLASGLGTINGPSVLISFAALAILLLGRRLWKTAPWALVVLVVATAAVSLTNAADDGVAVLGQVDSGLPSFAFPEADLGTWLTLFPAALALTFVTTAEGLLVSREYGEKRHYPTDPNRDLVAFGAANLACGVQGSFVYGASTSRTAAIDQTGSRTQLPALVAAGGAVLMLVFGTDLLANIPSPAIGAIVGVAVLPLLGLADFRGLWALSRFEFAVGAVCFTTTLLVGPVIGIVVAFVLALVNLARRASHPAIDVLVRGDDPTGALIVTAGPGAQSAPGVVVVRMAAPLFFANGAAYEDGAKAAVTQAGGPRVIRHVVLDMEAVTDVDVTGSESFAELRTWLAENDVDLSFARVRPTAQERLERFGILQGETIYPTGRDAVLALSDLRSGGD